MRKLLVKLALYILKNSEKERDIILTEAVKKLFCTVSADEILKENPDGTIQFEGKTLDASYKKNLQEQANLLTNMLLWKVLKKDVEYQLRKKMFEETVLNGDMVWGKLLTFLWDIINTRITRLK